MVFLKRTVTGNRRTRAATPSPDIHFSTAAVVSPCNPAVSTDVGNARRKGVAGREVEEGVQDVNAMVSILAEAGCTVRVSGDAPPSLPTDIYKLRRNLEIRLSTGDDPDFLPFFVSGFSSYIQNPQNLRRVLIPSSYDGGGSSSGESIVRVLLLVAPIQKHVLNLLLEKLPEYFNDDGADANCSLKDDIPRLIVSQLRWLDFLVDSEGLAEKLMEVLSISPPALKKEIIGSLAEIIGDKNHGMVVSTLAKMLLEDSDIIVPVLDSFSNLNLDEELQEQVVTIALSCIRTVDAEHIPYLLRFLLLSATCANAGRIISQIREHLNFVGLVDPYSARNKLKGKSLADCTEASILGALQSSLRFKNMLCEAVLKELKHIDRPHFHKVMDVWLLMLIYGNGGQLQKNAKKIMKRKIIDGCFTKALFDNCITGHQQLVKDYFSSFISFCEYLLSCKEKQGRYFGIHLYKSLFEELKDICSRQEVLGALLTHIGSGNDQEVNSALETLNLLAVRHSEDLIPFASYLTGIMDHMENFDDANLHKIYEVFCHLACGTRSDANTTRSSIANEVLMIIRKQVSSADMTCKKMGIVGTLKLVSIIGSTNSSHTLLSSQNSISEDALELLQMSFDSCKLVPSAVIVLYDELIALLDHSSVTPTILEWIGNHVSEFESIFLSDLEGGELPSNIVSHGIEGELWVNLDGEISPICVKILPLLSSSLQQKQSLLQVLPSQFMLLSVLERLTNQGSLGGVDALLGCPLLLPSPKYYLSVVHWKKLTEKQKHIVCVSLYYAVNWIRQLLNAFSSQIADKVEITTLNTKHVFIDKLMKRLRNLIVMETILNNLLKAWPLSLPEVCYHLEQSGPLFFQGKKSTQRLLRENIPSNKNKKQKTDPSVLLSSESSGKLRQPTIFDTLKRAGVLMNEGTSGEVSPRHPPHKKTSKSAEHHDIDADELEVMDISIEPKYLDAQRLKFRPLNVESLSLLSVTKCSDTCCADPKAELPLHLYLLRDFRRKLDDLRLLGEQFLTPCIDKVSPSFDKMKNSQLICKVRPIFRSLRKHLDIAVSILKGSEACHDHWTSQSCSAGNPDLSNLVVSETTVASSVFREVLGCYNRMLCLDEIYHQENLQILRDMLEAFQATEALGGYFSGFQPLPSSGSIDYLYCGVYLFFESILESSFSVSFLLASEVIVTLHSLVNPKTALIGKAQDVMGKNSPISCSYKVLHHLKGRLGLSAHKLLLQDWSSKENDNEWKSKGDILQKILQIYLKNTESASDLLNELACSILPQVPSCKTKNTEEATHGFRTLSPTMFLTWYKVLQEENINVLSNLVKEVKLKNGVFAGEDAGKVLLKIQQAVEVVVSLVSMCKVHDKVAVHAMAVKYGGKFVDLFLKAFDFLQDQFHSHSDLIIKMLKELQKATRIIQALCSDAKGSKRTMVTNKVPSTKRTMERLLFRVKALFHNTATDYTFWMGNLKHKDVYGQVVSSQVYCNEDDYNDPQLEDQL